MNLIRRFAEHRLAANLAMIIMTLAGLWAVRVMPTQLDPPANFPLVFVEVAWRGASAEDIEALITDPVEQQLRTLPNLHELTSRTEEGFVRVAAQFTFDADISDALDQVKQRVANIRNLPSDIEPPVVRRLVDLEPISAAVVTTTGSLESLIPILREFERDLYARGVEQIYYDGFPAMEIAVQVSGRQLHQLGMTLDELAAEISRLSANVPAGTVGVGQGAHALRSLDQARDALSFETLAIATEQRLVPLGEIADVTRRPERGQPFLSREGRPAVEMMLMRRTDTDAWVAHQTVEDWLQEARSELPSGITVDTTISVWQLLGAQLSMILLNGLTGLVLVILVLYVFLSGRVAWWVTVGIPVSFLLGLALFHLVFGFGISIIALIGFIMALGIVVDDAIVVGEDVVTLHEGGQSSLDAAVHGAERMWVPVVTSSLTTLAAFLPLLIIGGIMGDIILALPTVLLCVIIASLVECFAVLPGHLRGSLSAPAKPMPEWRQRFNAGFRKFRDTTFTRWVTAALNNPGATVLTAVAGFFVALSLIVSQHVPFNMVTGFDFESLEVNVQFASHATEEDRLEFIDHLEDGLNDANEALSPADASRNVLSYTTRLNLAEFNQDDMTGEQYASINAQYAFEEQRTVSPETFVKNWRQRIQQPSFIEQFTIGVEGGQNNGQADLTLVLRGQQLDNVKNGALALKQSLAAYPGVTNIVDDLPFGKEQIVFRLTPRGRALGLTTAQVGAQLRAAYSGALVQIFNEHESEVEVRVTLPHAEQDDISQLQQFPIKTSDGTLVPLRSVAVLYNRRGIDLIRHRDGQMAARISADVDSEVSNALNLIEKVRADDLPEILETYDLSFGLGGKSAQDQVIMNTMALGGALTMVLIYLILAWTFSSYLWPLAIMMAIPFGFTGAVFGHWVTGWDVGAMSLLAFFSLTGIVVNDSIVLISFFKRDIESGTPIRQALERAITARFRAVLLTSLTTIAGLTPLMFETSSLAFYLAPIAVTLCFGLAFATTLVLFVIPALILLLENGKARLNAFWLNRKPQFLGEQL